MSKVRKVVDALIGKSGDACKCAEPCTMKEAYRKAYRVEATVSPKYWNKELQVYLFVDPSKHGGEILAVKSRNVEFKAVEDMWRITDALFNGTFESVKITTINTKNKKDE